MCIGSVLQVDDRHSKLWSGDVVTRATVLLTFSSRNGVLTGKQDQKCRSSSPTATYKCFSSHWMSFGTISATGEKILSHHSKLSYEKWECKASKGVQRYTFLLESQKSWVGGNTEVLHTWSRTISSIRSGQLLFTATYLEACILYREIYARQRIDTKPNPGLEAVYLYCSTSVAVLPLGPAPWSLHSTVLNTVWWILQAFPSLLCWQWEYGHSMKKMKNPGTLLKNPR